MAEQVDHSLDKEKLVCTVPSCFGALALLLAWIGLFEAMSYTLARRTSEIGVRMALGAEKGDVLRIAIRQGLRIALVGLAIGAVAAIMLRRLLSSFSQLLYGVRARDPLTIIAVSLVLSVVAVLACYIPARREMRVDPNVALRYESLAPQSF